MNTLREIWDSVIERFKNPLFYAFVFSWCVVNYRILIAVLGEAGFREKIDFIEQEIGTSSGMNYWRLVCLPAAAAVLYVFVFPLLSLLTTWTNAVFERWHSNIRARESRLGILTKIQREKLEAEVADLNNRLRIEAQSQKGTSRNPL